MELRKQKYGDIYAEDVSFMSIMWCAAVGLIAAILIISFVDLLANSIFEYNYTTSCEHNRAAEIVNQLPLDQRKEIAGQLDAELDSETHLIPMVNLESREKSQVIFGRMFWPIAALALLLIPSIRSTRYFCSNKKTKYFLADLPYRGFKKFVLLLILWTMWPAMVVSYCRLRKFRQEQELIQEARRQAPERAKAMARKQLQLSDDELAELSEDEIDAELEQVIQAEIPHSFTESDYITYRKARHSLSQENRSIRIQIIEDEIATFENKIKRYAAQIQNIQKEISAEQATLRESRNKPESTLLDDQQTAKEWQELQTMRGVYRINTRHDHNGMTIYVRVRLPYKGVIYDLGDFKIEIKRDSGYNYCQLRAFEIRLSKNPEDMNFYSTRGNEFCFGNSAEEIHDYLRQNNLTAAVALAIDRLHFINERDRYSIPHRFQPIQTLEEVGEPK